MADGDDSAVPEIRARFPALPATVNGGEGGGCSREWRRSGGTGRRGPVAIVVDEPPWCDEDTCNLVASHRRLERSPVPLARLLALGEVERDAPASRLCRALRAKSHAEVSR